VAQNAALLEIAAILVEFMKSLQGLQSPSRNTICGTMQSLALQICQQKAHVFCRVAVFEGRPAGSAELGSLQSNGGEPQAADRSYTENPVSCL